GEFAPVFTQNALDRLIGDVFSGAWTLFNRWNYKIVRASFTDPHGLAVGLRASVRWRGGERYYSCTITAQGVVVVPVFVTGEDAEDPHADPVGERVLDEVGIARVVEHGGELPRQADPFIELPQRQQAGVRGERGVGDLDRDGQGLEKSNSNSAAGCK